MKYEPDPLLPYSRMQALKQLIKISNAPDTTGAGTGNAADGLGPDQICQFFSMIARTLHLLANWLDSAYR